MADVFDLESLMKAIGGSFSVGLSEVFSKLGEIRAEVPDAAEQIDQLTTWFEEKTRGTWSRESLIAIAKQIVALVTGEGWGPPNPGAVALQ